MAWIARPSTTKTPESGASARAPAGPRPFAPGAQRPAWRPGQRRDAPSPNALPGTLATMNHRLTGWQAGTVAIAQGMLRFPDEISALVEDLHLLSRESREIDALLTAHEAGTPLEIARLPSIFGDGGALSRTSFRSQAMEVDFREDTGDAQPLRDEFRRLVRIWAQRRRLEAATSAAFTRFQSDLTDENFEAHRRLDEALTTFVTENWNSRPD